MEFGKLPDIALADFSFPPDLPGNANILANAAPRSSWPWHTGATGWGMKEWVGSYYPKGTTSKDFLKAYAAQFNTIELNTTHYRIPDEATVARWAEQTPEDFRFCPKIPQTISHARELGTDGGAIAAFCRAIAGLGSRLGPCFLQLPPTFGPERTAALQRFLQSWPAELPIAVEFRHPAWFSGAAPLEQAAEVLERAGAGTVITDVAGRRDVLHMRLSAPFMLVRFVGNGLHPTDFARVQDWIARVRSWFETGLQNIFFFTHEPDNIMAPQLAAYLTERLQADHGPWQTRGPRLLSGEPENGQFRLF